MPPRHPHSPETLQPSKRVHRSDENTIQAQRRSVRDRSQQKTPAQQAEELSDILVGTTKKARGKNKSIILDNATQNPMAPDSGKKKRVMKPKQANTTGVPPTNTAVPTSTPPSMHDVTHVLPELSMEQFAAIVTGRNLSSLPQNSNAHLRFNSPPKSPQIGATPEIGSGHSQPKSVNNDARPDILSQPRNSTNAPQDSHEYSFDFSLDDYPQGDFLSTDFIPSINLANDSMPNFTPMVNWNTDAYMMECAQQSPDQQSPLMTSSVPTMALLSGESAGHSASRSTKVTGGTTTADGEEELGSGDDDYNDDNEIGDSGEEEIRSSDEEDNNEVLDDLSMNAIRLDPRVRELEKNLKDTQAELVKAQNRIAAVAKARASAELQVVGGPSGDSSVLSTHYKKNRRPLPPSVEKLSRKPDITRSSSPSRNERKDIYISEVTGKGMMSESMRRSRVVPPSPLSNEVFFGQDGPGKPVSRHSPLRTHSAPVIVTSDAEGVRGNETTETEGGRTTRNSKTPRTADDPQKLEYYIVRFPNWGKVIRICKGKIRVWVSSLYPFAEKLEHLNTTLSNMLDEAIDEFQAEGGRLEEGVFETHKDDILEIMWDEVATFRGEIKTLAREIIKGYGFIPKTVQSAETFRQEIVDSIRALLHGAFFLRDGIDEQGRTNNFCHPLLMQLCMAIFYSKSRVTPRFRQAFGTEIPRQAMALLAAAMRCALLEWKGGSRINIPFTHADFKGTYDKMMQLIDEIEADPIQLAKFTNTRQSWARAGQAQSGGAVEEDDPDFAVGM